MAKTPTVYRWDDAGAPDISTLLPSDTAKDLRIFHTIIKACLVDGYGSKAAAGWSMPLEEITSNGCRFVLKNAAESGALLYEGGSFCHATAPGYGNNMWACSSVTDMDSPINAWSHKTKYESKSTAFGDNYHSNGINIGRFANAWVVIANENTVALFTGRTSVEFSKSSTATIVGTYSGLTVFGAMITESENNTPQVGNFSIMGGNASRYNGTSGGDSMSDVVSTGVDILGVPKANNHSYKVASLTSQKTSSPLSAWLPLPVVYYQYGSSSPYGNDTGHTHFLCAIPAIKRLMFSQANYSDLNKFMNDNGFEYGKPFDYLGGRWVIFKASQSILTVVSLDPSEWGV